MAPPSLHQLLKVMIEKGASDLHVTSGTPPQLRIDGHLVRLRTDALTPVDTRQLCYSVLTDQQKLRFEEDLELDLSFGVKNLARFRANVFMQRGAVGGPLGQPGYLGLSGYALPFARPVCPDIRGAGCGHLARCWSPDLCDSAAAGNVE